MKDSGRLAGYAGIIATVLALLGGVYSISQSVSSIERQLDRNCDYIRDLTIAIAVTSEPRNERPHGSIYPFPDVRC